ncbi:MAG: hypothetical protein HUJ61_07600, partial [Bacilli bacterium]|nr:hypothetical protein [Bacilli bacterium]
MARAKRKADYYVKPIYNQSDIYKRFLEVIVYNKIPLDFFEKLTIKDCYLYFSRCNYLEAHIDVNYNAQCDREVLHTYVDYETRYDSSGHSERVPVTRFYTEHVPFSISGTYDYRLWSVGGVDDITKPEMIPLDEDYPICEIE